MSKRKTDRAVGAVLGILVTILFAVAFIPVYEKSEATIVSDNPITDMWKECRSVDGEFEMADATCGGNDCYMVKCDVPEHNLFRHFIEE